MGRDFPRGVLAVPLCALPLPTAGVVCQDYPQFTEKQSMQTTAASAPPLASISIDIGKDISHLG